MDNYMNNWSARREIFRTMPLRSFLTFCLAVACTFAAIGVVNDLFDLERSDGKHLLLKVLTTSSFAVLCVLFVHRRTPKLLLALAATQLLWLIGSARVFPPAQQLPRVLHLARARRRSGAQRVSRGLPDEGPRIRQEPGEDFVPGRHV